MDKIDLVALVVTLVSGGTFGILINRLFDRRKNAAEADSIRLDANLKVTGTVMNIADGLRQDVERQEKRIQFLEQKQTETAEEMARLQEANAELRATVQIAQAKIERLITENEELSRENDALREKLDVLQNKLAAAEERWNSADSAF